MAYVNREEMQRFIRQMFEYNLTPNRLLGPYLKEKYRRRYGREPELLTIEQMQKYLGVSQSTIYRYMKEGMPYESLPNRPKRGRLFDKELCQAYLNQRKVMKKKERRLARE